MGETGCGKTRLIKYMCELLSLNSPDSKTLVIMKVIVGVATWYWCRGSGQVGSISPYDMKEHTFKLLTECASYQAHHD